MKVELGFWDRLSRFIVILLVLAALVVVVHSYLPQIRKNESWRRQIHDRQAEIRLELQRSNRLRTEIESFRDARTIERLARENLNYARSNEVVIRFDESSNTSPPRR